MGPAAAVGAGPAARTSVATARGRGSARRRRAGTIRELAVDDDASCRGWGVATSPCLVALVAQFTCELLRPHVHTEIPWLISN
eukprot:COSAG04_NODE_10592_length_766_cov_0.535232_1_plen_82_part_10